MTTESTTTVEVDGMRVAVEVRRDPDGTPFIELVPDNCKLEGEMPGMYYPVLDDGEASAIATLVEEGAEHEARRVHGDATVDGWFRSIGWNPDAARVALDALS